ncbi:uncharacterized mitochondrial protein AtMg00860-like [Henckelia pumila]|uniref:uncharacterized mitochondrial protein AtMg00860-like n=1 Tax=Henckelia pumila TaxID=405737 RepID=UPI003C6DBDC6
MDEHAYHLFTVMQVFRERQLYANLSKCDFWIDRVVFLGYYRRFVENFSQIDRPLTQLRKKDASFVWSDACEDSFYELRRCLTTAPVLALPSGSCGFVVFTDASLQGLRLDGPGGSLQE